MDMNTHGKINNTILIIILISCGIHITGISQKNEFLQKLESALFPKCTDSVRLINNLKDCRHNFMDSTIYIPKIQPNYQQVMQIMEKILYSGDTSLMNPLILMYDKYIDIFNQEWRNVNQDQIIYCSIIRHQISYMEGFERILSGLHLRDMTSTEKFDFFNNRFVLRYQLSNFEIHDSLYIGKYLYFNRRYIKIIEPTYFMGYSSFDYVDPYIDEIAPFIIKKVQENKVIPNFGGIEERFLFSNQRIFAKIKDPAMAEALKEVLRHDTLGNKTNTWTFVEYLEENHDEEMVQLVIEKLAKDFPGKNLDGYYFRTINNSILKVKKNEAAVLKALVKLFQKDSNSKEEAKKMIHDLGESKVKMLLKNNKDLTKEVQKCTEMLIKEINVNDKKKINTSQYQHLTSALSK